MKQCNHRTGQDEPQTITKAVTHIRLEAINAGKLAALDDLAQVYLPLCQQYVTLFCTDELPDKFRAICFATPLSERWHRVAIQQAAGIAKSWRTNRAQAYQDYLDDVLDYHQQEAEGTLDAEAKEPAWKECSIPILRHICIQANVNVAVLEPAHDSTFDYWLKISTLAFRKQLLVPVKLATVRMPIRMRPSTSSIAGETRKYAPARTGKQSKPCSCRGTRHGRHKTVGRRTRRPPSSFVNGRRLRLEVWVM